MRRAPTSILPCSLLDLSTDPTKPLNSSCCCKQQFEKLRSNGFHPHEITRQFFHKYGSDKNYRVKVPTGSYWLQFGFWKDGDIAFVEQETVDYYSRQLGTNLCPVGTAFNGHTLVVGDNGSVYAILDQQCQLIEGTIPGAISKLFSGVMNYRDTDQEGDASWGSS